MAFKPEDSLCWLTASVLRSLGETQVRVTCATCEAVSLKIASLGQTNQLIKTRCPQGRQHGRSLRVEWDDKAVRLLSPTGQVIDTFGPPERMP